MLGSQAPDDFHILRAQPTPLHHLGNKHSQFLAHSISGSQKKVRTPLFAPNGAKHERSAGLLLSERLSEAPPVLITRYPSRVACPSRVRVKSAKHLRPGWSGAE